MNFKEYVFRELCKIMYDKFCKTTKTCKTNSVPDFRPPQNKNKKKVNFKIKF